MSVMIADELLSTYADVLSLHDPIFEYYMFVFMPVLHTFLEKYSFECKEHILGQRRWAKKAVAAAESVNVIDEQR